MQLEDWKKVAFELATYRQKTGFSPQIMLWGGEPLICPFFEELVVFLRENGFELGMVTNGTMINRFPDLIAKEFKHIYVSVDGDREIHDAIRGVGVFDAVAKNLEMIYKKGVYISLNTVITEDYISSYDSILREMSLLSCDEIILQEMIVLDDDEISQYKKWMKDCFDINASEIESWKGHIDNSEKINAKKQEMLKNIKENNYSKPIKYLPHTEGDIYCQSPFLHMHIAWNGNVLYCTDFYDFSAGNVREDNVISIFNNSRSEKFREEIKNGHSAACKHCSWRNSKTFKM